MNNDTANLHAAIRLILSELAAMKQDVLAIQTVLGHMEAEMTTMLKRLPAQRIARK